MVGKNFLRSDRNRRTRANLDLDESNKSENDAVYDNFIKNSCKNTKASGSK